MENFVSKKSGLSSLKEILHMKTRISIISMCQLSQAYLAWNNLHFYRVIRHIRKSVYTNLCTFILSARYFWNFYPVWILQTKWIISRLMPRNWQLTNRTSKTFIHNENQKYYKIRNSKTLVIEIILFSDGDSECKWFEN